MQFDFYLARSRGSKYKGPIILSVDNCSEVVLLGSSIERWKYEQDGLYYDYCCDFRNEDDPKCQIWVNYLVISVFFLIWFSCYCYCCGIHNWLPSCFTSCANACYEKCQQIIAFCRQRPGACCDRQTPVRNDNSVMRYSTERPNISTISDNLRPIAAMSALFSLRMRATMA